MLQTDKYYIHKLLYYVKIIIINTIYRAHTEQNQILQIKITTPEGHTTPLF